MTQVDSPAAIHRCPPDEGGAGLAFSPGAQVFDDTIGADGVGPHLLLRYTPPSAPNQIITIQGFVVLASEVTPEGVTSYFHNVIAMRDLSGVLAFGDPGVTLLTSEGPATALTWGLDGEDIIAEVDGEALRNVFRFHFVASAIQSSLPLMPYTPPP